jgi:DNA-binding MarR family transcriptional regulator
MPSANGNHAKDRTLDWGPFSDSVGPRIRLLRNVLQARSIAVSEPFGLPTGSLTIMCLIGANPGSSQKQLAEWAGITSPGLVGVVDELEGRGLVARVRSLTDRRRNSLVLSEKGQRTMETMLTAVSQIEAPIRDVLGQADMHRLIDMIDRAVHAMQQHKD